jgi:hypothetical protein
LVCLRHVLSSCSTGVFTDGIQVGSVSSNLKPPTTREDHVYCRNDLVSHWYTLQIHSAFNAVKSECWLRLEDWFVLYRHDRGIPRPFSLVVHRDGGTHIQRAIRAVRARGTNIEVCHHQDRTQYRSNVSGRAVVVISVKGDAIYQWVRLYGTEG